MDDPRGGGMIGKNYYYFFLFLVLKSILRYVKDVSLTKPTLMGGPKEMGGGVG